MWSWICLGFGMAAKLWIWSYNWAAPENQKLDYCSIRQAKSSRKARVCACASAAMVV